MLNALCTMLISSLGVSVLFVPDQTMDCGNPKLDHAPIAASLAAQSAEAKPADDAGVEAERNAAGDIEEAASTEDADEADATDPVHAILDRLEASAADLDAFTATILYENYDELLGRREIRTGEIIYRIQQSDQSARAITSFAVLFDALIIGQRRSERLKHYIFHDRWLAEVDHESRQFIKRELVPPGRQLDPLKLGEGPIPLPIGQPKDEVLARFNVELHELPEDGPLARLENVDGLLLIPKEGTPEADEYQRVELYYDRETNLPVGINAIERNENRKTVRLTNVNRNPDLTDEQLTNLSVEEPDPRRWSIDVRPYRTGS